MKKFSRNTAVGCSHNCVYCYARAMALENGTIRSSEEWSRERIVPEKLHEGQSPTPGVLYSFPTHHDITPALLQPALVYIGNLLRAGNAVEVWSKPHLECIRAICDTFPMYTDKLRFRFTIGSTNAATCAWLEPGAPPPEERIEALKLVSRRGFKTNVSIEPLLEDEVGTSDVIRRVYPYVTEGISIGCMCNLSKRLSLQGSEREEVVRYFQFINSYSTIRAIHERYKGDPKILWEKTVAELLEIKKPFVSFVVGQPVQPQSEHADRTPKVLIKVSDNNGETRGAFQPKIQGERTEDSLPPSRPGRMKWKP